MCRSGISTIETSVSVPDRAAHAELDSCVSLLVDELAEIWWDFV